jgi:hypothetical protein
MAKKMKNLPDGIEEDRSNNVYYDTEEKKFYFIIWRDKNKYENPERIYLDIQVTTA